MQDNVRIEDFLKLLIFGVNICLGQNVECIKFTYLYNLLTLLEFNSYFTFLNYNYSNSFDLAPLSLPSRYHLRLNVIHGNRFNPNVFHLVRAPISIYATV